MSQSTDYTVSDQGMPDARTEINAILAAILSHNSGTSAPAYAAAGTIWIDTDTPGSGVWTVYMNDGTDNIALGQLDTTNNTWTSTNGVKTNVTPSFTVAINEAAYVDVASATTCDIGAAASNNVRITGTTTITGLGSGAAGITRRVRFAGILTLTHNATSLILPTAANIATAADDCATFTSLGSGNWICTAYQRKSGAALTAPASSGSQFAIYEDQKADGTDGGGSTGGLWGTRVINTEVADPDGIGSVAANRITLGAGDYMIRAWAAFVQVNGCRLRIQNITDGTTALLGHTNSALSAEGNEYAQVSGYVSIAGTKAFELQYFCQTSVATVGLGQDDNITAGVEIYAHVEIEKLS